MVNPFICCRQVACGGVINEGHTFFFLGCGAGGGVNCDATCGPGGTGGGGGCERPSCTNLNAFDPLEAFFFDFDADLDNEGVVPKFLLLANQAAY